MDANRGAAMECFKIALEAFLNADIEKATKFIKKAHQLFPSEGTEELLNKILELETNYTPEQLSEVERINGLKDCYEILKVSKNATTGEIEQSFRSLARLVHPDKCSAPKTHEASQALNCAKDILTDPMKRRAYDEFIYGELKKQRNYQESSGAQAEHANTEQRRSWLTATFWTGLISVIIAAGAAYFISTKPKPIAGKSKNNDA